MATVLLALCLLGTVAAQNSTVATTVSHANATSSVPSTTATTATASATGSNSGTRTSTAAAPNATVAATTTVGGNSTTTNATLAPTTATTTPNTTAATSTPHATTISSTTPPTTTTTTTTTLITTTTATTPPPPPPTTTQPPTIDFQTSSAATDDVRPSSVAPTDQNEYCGTSGIKCAACSPVLASPAMPSPTACTDEYTQCNVFSRQSGNCSTSAEPVCVDSHLQCGSSADDFEDDTNGHVFQQCYSSEQCQQRTGLICVAMGVRAVWSVACLPPECRLCGFYGRCVVSVLEDPEGDTRYDWAGCEARFPTFDDAWSAESELFPDVWIRGERRVHVLLDLAASSPVALAASRLANKSADVFESFRVRLAAHLGGTSSDDVELVKLVQYGDEPSGDLVMAMPYALRFNLLELFGQSVDQRPFFFTELRIVGVKPIDSPPEVIGAHRAQLSWPLAALLLAGATLGVFSKHHQ